MRQSARREAKAESWKYSTWIALLTLKLWLSQDYNNNNNNRLRTQPWANLLNSFHHTMSWRDWVISQTDITLSLDFLVFSFFLFLLSSPYIFPCLKNYTWISLRNICLWFSCPLRLLVKWTSQPIFLHYSQYSFWNPVQWRSNHQI